VQNDPIVKALVQLEDEAVMDAVISVKAASIDPKLDR